MGRLTHEAMFSGLQKQSNTATPETTRKCFSVSSSIGKLSSPFQNSGGPVHLEQKRGQSNQNPPPAETQEMFASRKYQLSTLKRAVGVERTMFPSLRSCAGSHFWGGFFGTGPLPHLSNAQSARLFQSNSAAAPDLRALLSALFGVEALSGTSQLWALGKSDDRTPPARGCGRDCRCWPAQGP